MSNKYKFVIVIKNIKDPNKVVSGGLSNKYKGAYKKIFDILDEDSIFIESELEDEKLKGNYFYLYFNSIPDADKLELISKIPNVEIITQKYGQGGLIAPNGKPSNLTAEQYKLVRTPEFKKWFGDWENDPANASKVVDENGEPIICYHGSEKKFNVFDVNKISSKTTTDVAKLGFWFTTELWEAEGFAYGFDESERVEGVGKVYQCFLNIKKPLKINLIQKELKKTYNPNYDIAGMYIEENQNEIKKIFNNSKKFDGYNLDNIWLSINPNQIKLADGTNTTFDKNNNDIRFEKGGIADSGTPHYLKFLIG